MKKLLIITFAFGLAANSQAGIIRRVEEITKPETTQQQNEKLSLERRMQIVEEISVFMSSLTGKYCDQIGMAAPNPNAVPTAHVSFYENPAYQPESKETPHYLYVFGKQPSEPVELMNGKPAVFRAMQDFAKQLESKYPEIGFTCAGGTKQPKDIVLRFNNPDFKPGTAGSGKYCRVYMKSAEA